MQRMCILLALFSELTFSSLIVLEIKFFPCTPNFIWLASNTMITCFINYAHKYAHLNTVCNAAKQRT